MCCCNSDDQVDIRFELEDGTAAKYQGNGFPVDQTPRVYDILSVRLRYGWDGEDQMTFTVRPKADGGSNE